MLSFQHATNKKNIKQQPPVFVFQLRHPDGSLGFLKQLSIMDRKCFVIVAADAARKRPCLSANTICFRRAYMANAQSLEVDLCQQKLCHITVVTINVQKTHSQIPGKHLPNGGVPAKNNESTSWHTELIVNKEPPSTGVSNVGQGESCESRTCVFFTHTHVIWILCQTCKPQTMFFFKEKIILDAPETTPFKWWPSWIFVC